MKHKRTKVTEISMKTKEIVWERDNHQCIFCGRMYLRLAMIAIGKKILGMSN